MRLVLPTFLVAALLAGCSSSPDPTPSMSRSDDQAPGATHGTTGPSPTAPFAPTSPPPATASGAPPATAGALPLPEVRATWRVVGEGFDNPVQVLAGPDGRAVVVEQTGRIRTLDGATTVLDLTGRVTAGGERGLLGVALAPDGARLFVHYTGPGGRTVLSVFPVVGGAVDAAGETVLFEHPQPAANHNGGSLLFDPDGALVLALGDGGGAGDQYGNGQDPGTVLGALLRFDVQGDRLQPASGNPFVDGGGAAEVWAYGLRNPWRVAVDEQHLYVADVGQDAVEEVDVVARRDVAGANFGWPLLEGTSCFRADGCDPSGTVRPVAQLRHADGACSIIGGVVVPDGHPTGLGGAYLYSDLCDTQLRALRSSAPSDTVVVQGATIPASPLGFGAGPDGQVWVGTTEGQVLQLAPS